LFNIYSSLPHRQLRKLLSLFDYLFLCSLPHRQLRNRRYFIECEKRLFTAAQAA